MTTAAQPLTAAQNEARRRWTSRVSPRAPLTCPRLPKLAALGWGELASSIAGDQADALRETVGLCVSAAAAAAQAASDARDTMRLAVTVALAYELLSAAHSLRSYLDATSSDAAPADDDLDVAASRIGGECGVAAQLAYERIREIAAGASDPVLAGIAGRAAAAIETGLKRMSY